MSFAFLKKNSLTVVLNKIEKYSAFKGEWSYKIPRDFIDAVLSNEDVNDRGERLISDVCKASFKNNIVDRLRNDTLTVEWKPTDKIPFGRRYSGGFKENQSTANFGVQARSIKNSYFEREGWVDFDLVKCHPQLICELIRTSGKNLEYGILQEYINDFDSISKRLIDVYSADKKNPLNSDDIKGLFNLTIYGGSFNTWKKWMETDDPKKNYVGKPVQNMMSPFYAKFNKCVRDFREAIIADNKELLDVIIKAKPLRYDEIQKRMETPEEARHRQERSLLSYYLQIFENHCLYIGYKTMLDNKWIDPRKADLCYDGFTTKLLEGCPEMDLILQTINNEIVKKTGIQMTFKNKPFKDTVPSIVNLPQRDDDDNSSKDNLEELKALAIVRWDTILNPYNLAIRLLDNWGDNICLCQKSLFVFRNGRWYNETDEKQPRSNLNAYITGDLFAVVKELFENDDVLIADTKTALKIHSRLLSGLRGDYSKIRSLEKHILANAREVDDIFDKNPFLLGFNNGVIELNTGLFRPYKYDDYITFSCGYDYQSIDYSIPTNIELQETLKNILFDIHPDDDVRRLYLQTLASSLDGNQYQKLFLFTGAGGNGKGLTGSIMRQILGGYSYNPPAALIKDFNDKAGAASPDLIKMRGKRYIDFTEVKGVISTGTLRKLTGGDKIAARALYVDTCEFNLSSTIFMEFNDPPDLDGEPMEADYRRMVIVPFTNIFTDDESKIGKTINGKKYLKGNPYYVSHEFIQKIAPIFLDLLLGTYLTYYDEEIRGIKFDVPDVCKMATNAFMSNQNPIKQFMEANYVVEGEEKIKFKTLWEEFERSPEYRDCNKAKKRQFGRPKMYEYLESCYETFKDRNKFQFVKGLKGRYTDEDNYRVINDGDTDMEEN